MLMGVIWTGMILAAILFSCANGTTAEVGEAALEGAQAAVDLCLSIGGVMCLWCAVMELMRRCGIADALAKALRPVLRLLFPGDEKTLQLLHEEKQKLHEAWQRRRNARRKKRENLNNS